MIESHVKDSLMAKIAVIGPRDSGKSSFIKMIFQKFPSERRGEITLLDSHGDSIQCLEIFPANVPKVEEKEIHFQLAVVAGEISSELSWQLLLEDADAILFFVSSIAGSMEVNVKVLQDMEENMAVLGISWPSIPVLFVYNDRDAEHIYTVDELNAKLNRTNADVFETVVKKGHGVFKVLKAAITHVHDNIQVTAKPDNDKDSEKTLENKDENLSSSSGKDQEDVVNFKTPSGENTDHQQDSSEQEESVNVHGKSKLGFFGRFSKKRKK